MKPSSSRSKWYVSEEGKTKQTYDGCGKRESNEHYRSRQHDILIQAWTPVVLKYGQDSRGQGDGVLGTSTVNIYISDPKGRQSCRFKGFKGDWTVIQTMISWNNRVKILSMASWKKVNSLSDLHRFWHWILCVQSPHKLIPAKIMSSAFKDLTLMSLTQNILNINVRRLSSFAMN